MYVKFCEHCGRKFISKSNLKKYCSKDCARQVAKTRQEQEGQLCYICGNACGKCLWSKSFIPISGWDAQQTVVRDSEGDFSSYKIKACPEFIRG